MSVSTAGTRTIKTPPRDPDLLVRLNWGCGDRPAKAWLNADIQAYPGIQLRNDLRHGLPFAAASIDYIVSVHALQEIPVLELPGVLSEFRRVLKPGGVLRLALPNLDSAIAAYLRGDAAYFCVPDSDAHTLAGKFVIQMTWYGASRSMFTAGYTEELLLRAGFSAVHHCPFRGTHSPFPGITGLDDRERESFFIEAAK